MRWQYESLRLYIPIPRWVVLSIINSITVSRQSSITAPWFLTILKPFLERISMGQVWLYFQPGTSAVPRFIFAKKAQLRQIFLHLLGSPNKIRNFRFTDDSRRLPGKYFGRENDVADEWTANVSFQLLVTLQTNYRRFDALAVWDIWNISSEEELFIEYSSLYTFCLTTCSIV